MSVPTNIAEGAKRLTDREYERFLNIAEGSLAETQYLLMLSKDLGMADGTINATMEQAAEAARVLHGLRVKVASAR